MRQPREREKLARKRTKQASVYREYRPELSIVFHTAWLSALLLLLILLVSCRGASGQVGVSLGKQFSLSIGQTAVLSSDNLKIKFLDVIGDSRCPTGAICAWEGEVKAITEINDGSSRNVTLTEPGLTGQSKQTYDNYLFTFDVQPYPEVGKDIEKADYRLLLTVAKVK